LWIKNTGTLPGLISEGKGLYTGYFTAFDDSTPEKVEPLWHDGFGNMGKLTVQLVMVVIRQFHSATMYL
jgi:hypothetical protein